MKNLVVYYSWTGNTEVVAREIQKLAGADLKKIEEIKHRKSGIGFAGAGLSALLGIKSKLKTMNFSLKGYQNIFLGGQVWASRSTPAINTFISKTNFKNKKVYLFLTEADDKVPQKVIDSITKRIEKKGGKIVDSLYVTTKMGAVITPEAIKDKVSDFIKKAGL